MNRNINIWYARYLKSSPKGNMTHNLRTAAPEIIRQWELWLNLQAKSFFVSWYDSIIGRWWEVESGTLEEVGHSEYVLRSIHTMSPLLLKSLFCFWDSSKWTAVFHHMSPSQPHPAQKMGAGNHGLTSPKPWTQINSSSVGLFVTGMMSHTQERNLLRTFTQMQEEES